MSCIRTSWDGRSSWCASASARRSGRRCCPDGRAGAELIGAVGLSEVDDAGHCANLGYWVAEPVRGRGVATSAA
ncbi:GNAT family N-acetyltransferase [Luteimonas dalianensis]|uniref:GNAT family N-acetyltransferase n=1 Tax=Luteimonas dalianensis TaxID=1148196 RepID=UPI003BF0FDAE